MSNLMNTSEVEKDLDIIKSYRNDIALETKSMESQIGIINKLYESDNSKLLDEKGIMLTNAFIDVNRHYENSESLIRNTKGNYDEALISSEKKLDSIER